MSVTITNIKGNICIKVDKKYSWSFIDCSDNVTFENNEYCLTIDKDEMITFIHQAVSNDDNDECIYDSKNYIYNTCDDYEYNDGLISDGDTVVSGSFIKHKTLMYANHKTDKLQDVGGRHSSSIEYFFPYYKVVDIVNDSHNRICDISSNNEYKNITLDFYEKHRPLIRECDLNMMREIFSINNMNLKEDIDTYFDKLNLVGWELIFVITILQDHEMYNYIFEKMIEYVQLWDLYWLIKYSKTDKQTEMIIRKHPYLY